MDSRGASQHGSEGSDDDFDNTELTPQSDPAGDPNPTADSPNTSHLPHPDDRLWRHPSEYRQLGSDLDRSYKNPTYKAAHFSNSASAIASDTEGSARIPSTTLIAVTMAVALLLSLTFTYTTTRPQPSAQQVVEFRAQHGAGHAAEASGQHGAQHSAGHGPAGVQQESATQVRRGDIGSEQISHTATSAGSWDSAETAPLRDGSVGAETVSVAISAASAPSDLSDVEISVYDRVNISVAKIEVVKGSEMVEGAGVFVTQDGLLATSRTLIDTADYVIVRSLGERYPAEVVTSDSVSGIALLSIATQTSHPAELATAVSVNPTSLHPGSISAGALPGGSVHAGALPGGSVHAGALPAGAVVADGYGRVLGIYDEVSASIIPSWLIELVTADYLAYGAPQHPWFGATYTVEDTDSDPKYILVDIAVGSPAAHSGLTPGDIVTTVDGVYLDDVNSLWTHVITRDIGDSMILGIERDGQALTFELTLVAFDHHG